MVSTTSYALKSVSLITALTMGMVGRTCVLRTEVEVRSLWLPAFCLHSWSRCTHNIRHEGFFSITKNAFNYLACHSTHITETDKSTNVKVLVSQSRLTLCDPLDCIPPSSFVMGFSRQESWSGLSFPSPGDLPDPGIEPGSPALQTLYQLSHQGRQIYGFL